MRILMIGLTPTRKETGGSEKHICEIAKRLAKSYDISVLTQKGSMCSDFAKTFEINLPNTQLFRSLVFFVNVLVYVLFSKKYDIIHIHENYLFLLTPILKLRAKLVATVHGCVGFRYYDILPLRLIYFNLLKFANKVIFVSEHDYSLFKEKIPQAICIPNGVDISKFKQSKRVVDNVIYFGRFHPQKGIEYLLQAFANFVKQYKNYKLILIGKENDYCTYLKSLVESEKIPNVVFAGYVDDIVLTNTLESAKIIVLPSLFEGQSIAVLEALASGRPLITTNILANKFLERENTALLVEPADSEALASAIIKLVENNKLADKLAETGRKLSQKYDWNVIAELVGKTYGE